MAKKDPWLNRICGYVGCGVAKYGATWLGKVWHGYVGCGVARRVRRVKAGFVVTKYGAGRLSRVQRV